MDQEEARGCWGPVVMRFLNDHIGIAMNLSTPVSLFAHPLVHCVSDFI